MIKCLESFIDFYFKETVCCTIITNFHEYMPQIGFPHLSKSVFSDGLCQLTYDNISFFLHKIVAYDVICFKVTLPCKILTKLIILREILSFCRFRGFSRLSKSGFSDGLCQHTYDIICFFLS